MDVTQLRVLIVDDEPDIASNIRRLIRKELRCSVETAGSVASARRLFAGSDFDIVTLDYQLPDGDGLALLTELSSLDNPPCSILVTGHGDEQVAAQAFRAGAAGYVVKDIRLPTMLKDSISKAVSHLAFQEAQASLRRSEEELKLVSDSVPILVSRIGADQRYRYVNRGYCELFGRPSEWFTGRKVEDLLGEGYGRAAGHIERVLAGEEVTYENEMEVGGDRRVFNVNQLPIIDKSGTVVEYFSFIEDVTERKRAEEKLSRERDMLSRLMETSPVGILLLSPEGRIAYANREARSLLRRAGEPLVGAEFSVSDWEILDGGGNPIPADEHPLKLALQTGEAISGYRFWQRRETGELFQYSLNLGLLEDEAGEAEGLIGTILDITSEAERRSQLEFREQVLSNVSDAVVALDSDFRITYWSPAAEVVYGWAAGEAVGRRVDSLLDTTLLDITEREAAEIIDSGGQFRAAVKQVRKDGFELQLEAQLMGVRDISGRLSGYVGVARDVTERRRLEEHIRAERDLARLIVDTTPVGIFLTDDRGRINFMSTRAMEIMGRSFEDAAGLDMTDQEFDPRDLDMIPVPAADMPFAAVRSTRRPVYDRRLSFARPGGGRTAVSINASPVLEPGGDLRAVILSLEEISESLEREKELEHWGFITGAIDIGIVVVSVPDSKLEYVNERYAEMHGYTAGELEDESFWLLYPPGERERIAALVREGDRKGHYMLECTHLRKDGSTFPCLLSVECVRDLSQEPVRRVVTVQDMTMVRKAEDELQRLNRELEGYAHAASHDLRGPLAAVSLCIAHIKESLPEIGEGAARSDIEESVETAERNLRKAFTLISELLALAESGQHPPEVREVEVGPVVREVLQERSGELKRRRCRVEVDQEMGTLLAHPVQLYQVFSNIIGNAIVHNDSPDPILEVRYLGRDGSGANRYVVRDNGPGIPEDALDRIFIPFQAASGAAGSGIGLALVKKVIAVYGGDIELRNQEGARVEFTLKDYAPPPHR